MSSRSAAERDGFLAPARSVEGELRERGSRFLALLSPAGDEPTLRRRLDERRRLHGDATHHCWAARLGWPPRERSSDAGEPAGTAGAPILRSLRAAGVSDAVLVVSRWYGGTQLGRGGLVRAYAAAARVALEAATLTRRLPIREIRLTTPYEHFGSVQRLAAKHGATLRDPTFGERVAVLLEVSARDADSLEAGLADLGGAVAFRRISTRWST